MNEFFKTAYDALKEYSRVRRKISTGSAELDKILGGGIETGSITEIYGEFGSGKTQIAIQLSINVQLPENKGGLNSGSIYLDTEGSINPFRLFQVAEAVGLDAEEALKRIYLERVNNVQEMFKSTYKAEKLLKQGKVKLLVVDSLMYHFRLEYKGRENLFERQQRIKEYLKILRNYASAYNAAIVITNHVIEKPVTILEKSLVAAGGHIVSHVPALILQIRKTHGNKRILKVVDSSYIPVKEAIFQITDKGIT